MMIAQTLQFYVLGTADGANQNPKPGIYILSQWDFDPKRKSVL
jgi:hypothetical protein